MQSRPNDGVFAISPGHGSRKRSSLSTPREDEDEPEFDDEDDDNANFLVRRIAVVQTNLSEFYEEHEKAIWRTFYVVLLLAYIAYFCYAMYYYFGDEGSVRLLWITCLVVFFTVVHIIVDYYGKPISEMFQSVTKGFISKHEELISW